MRGKKFQMKVIVLMYKIQDFGWMNISQFIFDLYDMSTSVVGAKRIIL